ncbi:DUF1311 domain-containing protein [Sphingomonas sp. QA11]|uniref:lysozyme inhibitor LprI family protein n=1 Tax=Sphingomonas sp. QA11 TaxID=2950605 RepID=UPI00234BF1C8|nr:lysozyme inhibitor LprI family protein [Sphingomonas sp. QA11]WCM25935.1 DUF1311 domain-containing protein [Sphingomonas sp. QA11]
MASRSPMRAEPQCRMGHARHAILVAALSWAAHPALAENGRRDATAAALDHCLADPAHASTGDQTACETRAAGDYDRRMNVAYAALLRKLPPDAARKLRDAQRAWLAYRNAEAGAREAIYATRQGTMFVPLESDDAVVIVGDRARLLERYVRAMAVE